MNVFISHERSLELSSLYNCEIVSERSWARVFCNTCPGGPHLLGRAATVGIRAQFRGHTHLGLIRSGQRLI